MSDHRTDNDLAADDRVRARIFALARWENEGGAGLAPINIDAQLQRDTEADQLRVRVIALENLVIALLADATDDQRTLARDMADFISPRAGYTPHPLTLRAAEAMRSMGERSDRFRSAKPAIDEDVPTPAPSAALYQRFTSRGEAGFANQALSAVTHAFGGDVEKPAEDAR